MLVLSISSLSVKRLYSLLVYTIVAPCVVVFMATLASLICAASVFVKLQIAVNLWVFESQVGNSRYFSIMIIDPIADMLTRIRN